jgi:hypothetical protein
VTRLSGSTKSSLSRGPHRAAWSSPQDPLWSFHEDEPGAARCELTEVRQMEIVDVSRSAES